jgi:two-component system chemotaxis sensor kinase CheA
LSARDAEIKARLLATFRVEADEHVRALTGNLLALEGGLPAGQAHEVVAATFRAMHTLKGAARSVGLVDVEAVCHACELILSRIVHRRLTLTREITGLLQEAVDAVSALLAREADPAAAHELAGRLRLAAGEGGSGAGEPPRPSPRAAVEADRREVPSADTIRLDTRKLDALLLQGEELLAAKLAVEERTREARALVSELARSREELGRSPPAPRQTKATSELAQAEARARGLLERLARDRQMIGSAVDGLLEEIRRTRMMPASTVLDLFPRMVRDLAKDQGKEVEWSARGGELELDRRVLDTVKNPLIHLVRNAIDHGIEPPDERVAAGKPPRGRVAVTVSSLEDGRVEILVEDDGRGIDADRVREAGVRSWLVTVEAARALADEEALELVYRSGLSTSPVITDVSGHGLGLAIVREEVQRLEGDVSLDSRRGAGTRARLVLPSSITTFRGLLVRSGAQLFLLPVEATEHVVAVGPNEIGSVEGREAIRWKAEPVPVARLDAVLDLAPNEDRLDGREKRPCVIVGAGHERVGLLVDEVLGDEEVLVKDLSPPLVRVRHIAGAGLLGSGQIVLILRSSDLVKAGRRRLRPPAPARVAAAEDGRPPLVLVVDDALTTRTMERNLLEGVGYRVEVAVDGAEAWTALKTGEFDLVVSDVDMPRMDGFELTARIRSDPQLADLPVVLVSALEAREDKERGVEVGANAYVVKSSFEQSNLLEIIRRLGVVPGPEENR